MDKKELFARLEGARTQHIMGVLDDDEYIVFIFGELALFHDLVKVPIGQKEFKYLN